MGIFKVGKSKKKMISFLHELSGKKKMKTISKKCSKNFQKISKLFKTFSKKTPSCSYVVLGDPGWSYGDPMVILWWSCVVISGTATYV